MVNLSLLKNPSYLKKYPKGSFISGESGGSIMFEILQGEVGVVRNQKQQKAEVIATLNPGAFFVEPSLFTEKDTAVTTIALNDAIVLSIDERNAADFIKNEPELAYELFKELCVRLDKVSSELEAKNGRPWIDPDCSANGLRLQKPAEPAEEPPEQKTAPTAAEIAKTPSDKSASFSLFPEGHGCYELPLPKSDSVYLMKKKYECPICGKDFHTPVVRTSKLTLDHTDPDMRNHFKDIEPLYFDVIICPHCLFSALEQVFDKPDKLKTELRNELKNIIAEIRPENGKDTYSVFAGYYLALFCAPLSFSNNLLMTASLYLKLSRVYHDSGDEKMAETTERKALEAYMYAYENVEIPPKQDQQLCVTIGELYFKLGDIKNAAAFFYKAKMNKSGSPALKQHAEDRIYDIRHGDD